MIADVFVTAKGRDFLLKSLWSLNEHTNPQDYRLTVVLDGAREENESQLVELSSYASLPTIDRVIFHGQNDGLGPSINEALASIDVRNRWFADPRVGDPSQVAPFVCYCQDDVEYTSGWLRELAKWFTLFESSERLGFASGIECVEHPIKKRVNDKIVLKDWIRATNMFARREYWMSMWPITRFDPETGRSRAKPNDGVGSGVDWWFIRDHESSVCKTGRTNLVIPGLLRHVGYKDSTWLARELPESAADKAAMRG